MNTRSRVWLNRFRSRRYRHFPNLAAPAPKKPWCGRNVAMPGPPGPEPPPSAPSRSLGGPSPAPQALQCQSEGGPLHVELKLAVLGQLLQEVRQPLALPQAPEDQRRPPGPGLAGRQTGLTDGLHHPEFFTETGQTFQQAVQFAEAKRRSRRPKVPMICCLTLPPSR